MTSPFDRSHTLNLSQLTVHVAEAGPVDDKLPIVLLHGNPDTHHVWSGVVERLKSTRRCIAPDMPGYGATTEALDVTLEAQAEFVRELFDALKLDKAHLVIHDVGGTYGCAFASLHASRLATLSIMNSSFFPDYRWHFWGRVWRTPILGEIAMIFGNESLFVKEVKKASPKLPDDYARHAYAQYGKKTRRQVLRFYRYLSSSRLVGWDKQLLDALRTVKYQVLWGDLDPYMPKTTGDRLGASGGAVHHFPDLGHWAMAEDPERVARLVEQLVTM